MGTRQRLHRSLALMLVIPLLGGCGWTRYVRFQGGFDGNADVEPGGKSVVFPATGLKIGIQNEARVSYLGPDAELPKGPLTLEIANTGVHQVRIGPRSLAVREYRYWSENRGLTAQDALTDPYLHFPEDMPQDGLQIEPGSSAVLHFGERTKFPSHLIMCYKVGDREAEAILRLGLSDRRE